MGFNKGVVSIAGFYQGVLGAAYSNWPYYPVYSTYLNPNCKSGYEPTNYSSITDYSDQPYFSGKPFANLNVWIAQENTPTLVYAVPVYDDDDNIVYYITGWTGRDSSNSMWIEQKAVSDWRDYNSTYDNNGNYVTRISNGFSSAWVDPLTSVSFYPYWSEELQTIGFYLAHPSNVGRDDIYVYTCYTRMDLLLQVDSSVNGYNYTGHMEEVEESPEYGEASDVGGYGQGGNIGTFDDSSDTIGLPPMPSIGVSSVGFVNVYDISTGGLASFGMDLFPDLNFSPIGNLPAPADVTDALVNMATVLTTFGNQIPNMIDMYINKSLIDYIIDCHIIPVSPSVGGSENIKVGFKTFNQVANRVSSDYIDFDCGSLNIGEYYANFADYEPYTRCKLFLPFVGFVDLKPEFWQSGTIQVKYRFNVVDGSFTAFVLSSSSKSKLSNTVIAQYGGNCCVHIPITGANYSNLVSGVVGGAAAIMAAQPGTGGNAALDAAVNLANTKANVQQSNGYNATTSFLGVRKPYLMIERTVSNMSSAYPDEIGIPCNINLDFSNLSGLVQSQDVILDGITGATDAELKEIARLLAGGVYF